MHERIRRLATSEALECPQTCVLATRLSDRKREVSVGSDNVESLEGRNQILKVSGEDRSGARDSGVMTVCACASRDNAKNIEIHPCLMLYSDMRGSAVSPVITVPSRRDRFSRERKETTSDLKKRNSI
jgi:hypothetical protein